MCVLLVVSLCFSIYYKPIHQRLSSHKIFRMDNLSLLAHFGSTKKSFFFILFSVFMNKTWVDAWIIVAIIPTKQINFRFGKKILNWKIPLVKNYFRPLDMGWLLNNQQYCWTYCQQYWWISNIADNVTSKIASNIADQQYCQQYFWKISNIVGNIVSNIGLI